MRELAEAIRQLAQALNYNAVVNQRIEDGVMQRHREREEGMMTRHREREANRSTRSRSRWRTYQ